jgi:threonine/homoserine/homoserine lactone efflux protein
MLLPSASALLIFASAALLLALMPGPVVVYLVTRTLTQGRAAGLASVAGVALGNLGNALATALGLAALFALSSLAVTAVKLAGAAYLLWLALGALRRPPGPVQTQTPTPPAPPPSPPGRIFRDGLLVALLNPKTALFFAAFTPQFVDATAAWPALQALALSLVFVAIAALSDSLYVLLAAALAPLLRSAGGGALAAAGRYGAAAVYLALALYTAFSRSPAPTR